MNDEMDGWDNYVFIKCLTLADSVRIFLAQNQKALDTLCELGVFTDEYKRLVEFSNIAEEARRERIEAARRDELNQDDLDAALWENVSSDDDVRIAMINAFKQAGCSPKELMRQARENDFSSEQARMAWMAARDLVEYWPEDWEDEG